jgi:hypothetical protein
MGEVKTIKGVDEDVWAEFKSIAAEEKKNMGVLFEDIIKFYKEKKSKKVWENILTVKEPMNEYEAKIVKERIKNFREDFGGFTKTKWD